MCAVCVLFLKLSPHEPGTVQAEDIGWSSDTGNIKIPHAWAPDVVPLQLFRLGQLVIVNIPTELTTMAGRRLKKALKATLVEQGVLDAEGTVVISGLSNGYADYTTTFEEYQEQRYEGGSTIFGPLQLNGYIQEFLRLAVAMAQHQTVEAAVENGTWLLYV